MVFAVCRWAAIGLIFGWAIWLRFRLPLEPITVPDTWGYLSPAMGKLIGTGWTQHLRNYLYPGFLFLILRAFADFRAITVAQHLLGVAAGGVFLLVWRRVRAFAMMPRLPTQIYTATGLIAVSIYLFARQPMAYETDIRPEGIVSFLVMLNMWLIVEFAWRCWVHRTEPLPVGLGVAAVASAVVLSLAKPSFAIAAVGSLAPVAASLFSRFRFRDEIALVCGSAAAALLLLVPEQFLARGDESSETFLPTELFMIHAGIIRDQMAADVASGAPVPYPINWIRQVHELLDREIAKAALDRTYPTLGYNPDYLMYNPDSFNVRMRKEYGDDFRGLCDFYRFYYARAWRQQPRRMLEKIRRQMLVFYAPACPAYRDWNTRPIANEYAKSLASLTIANSGVVSAAYRPLARFIARTKELAATGLVLRVPRGIRDCERRLSRSYLLCLMTAAAIAAGVLVHPGLRRRLGLIAALVMFFSWYNFGNCIEIAVIHTLDVGRYDTTQLIFTVLAQFASFLLIAEFTFQASASLRGKIRSAHRSDPHLT